jgi:DNA polymerase III alpha subunit
MGMPDDYYCELHAHSNFSFLDGASHPEELIARAAQLGLPSLAITDHAGLYAAVRTWKAAQETETDAAREAGLSPVRPIIGLELTIPRTDDEMRLARRGRKLNDPLRGARASRGWPGEHHAGPIPGDHLVLLARDVDGYTALSRLASRGHLAGEKQFPIFERGLVETALDEARGHLFGLSGCRNGEVPRLLLGGDREGARAAAEAWAGHFADDDFHVELSHHLGPDDDWLTAQLAELAEETGLPTVVTNEAHYADPDGHRLQDVLVCIRHGATLEEARELLLPNAEYRLKSGTEMAAIGRSLPDGRSRRAWESGMARSAEIGGHCTLALGFERYRFPGFSVPKGETAFSYLYQLAHDGLLRRYQPVTKRALNQLAHELDIIDRTNLAEFFLIVWDLMEFARRGGIIGQGRGSAGDSIVAYCLGITKVDPIEHKLLFERFINEARALPDIDIDFDVNRREEVIQYLYTKYGADHAAMVCTIVTYGARLPPRWRGCARQGARHPRRGRCCARPRPGWIVRLALRRARHRHGRCGGPARPGRARVGAGGPRGRFLLERTTATEARSSAGQRERVGAAEAGARARRIGHDGAPRVGDHEAVCAIRRAGGRGAAAADAARHRFAGTVERPSAGDPAGSGERDAHRGTAPTASGARTGH